MPEHFVEKFHCLSCDGILGTTVQLQRSIPSNVWRKTEKLEFFSCIFSTSCVKYVFPPFRINLKYSSLLQDIFHAGVSMKSRNCINRT